MEGVHTAEAVIDNGQFGMVTIKFETGRLARLAAGSAVVYLDGETMILSATTAGKHHHSRCSRIDSSASHRPAPLASANLLSMPRIESGYFFAHSASSLLAAGLRFQSRERTARACASSRLP